jgi:hypothetical protein
VKKKRILREALWPFGNNFGLNQLMAAGPQHRDAQAVPRSAEMCRTGPQTFALVPKERSEFVSDRF